MLDRKTKDRDASVELLEDRLKQSKIAQWSMYLLGLVIFTFMGFCTIFILQENIELLLYFKERERK